MNELKQEDVMRALECCSKDDCDNCNNDFGNCYANLAGYALALLREKDARIKELEEAQGAEFTCFVGDPHKVDHCPYCDELARLQKEVAEKDAEIERLKGENEYLKKVEQAFNDCVDQIQKDQAEVKYLKHAIRAEAITEFAEMAKRRLPIVSPSVFDKIAKEMKGELDEN